MLHRVHVLYLLQIKMQRTPKIVEGSLYSQTKVKQTILMLSSLLESLFKQASFCLKSVPRSQPPLFTHCYALAVGRSYIMFGIYVVAAVLWIIPGADMHKMN